MSTKKCSLSKEDNIVKKLSGSLSSLHKIAYGIGSVGDSMSYNIFYSFFIYFMTTFAGIRPGLAGTISFIAVAWDAITDPLIGHYSDYCQSSKGRRIPFILFGSIPLGLTVFALFTNPDFSTFGKVIYYIVVNIAFWLAFTCVDIPYIALGSELTNDYDERTELRTWARVFMCIGDIAIISGTLLLVENIAKIVGSESQAWTIVGSIVGAISAVTFFVSGWLLRKHDQPLKKEVVIPSFNQIIGEYKQILHIREYQKVIGISLVANLIIGVGSSCNLFVWKYTFQLDTVSISMLGLISTIFCGFATFLAAWLAMKLGKKQSMEVAFAMIAIGLVILFFTPHTLFFAILGQIIKLSGISMFWTVIFSINYDIVEIDEFLHGKRREGMLISINSFFIKIGISFGMWFAGIMLDIFSVDPTLEQQTVQAVTKLNVVAMIVPIIIAIIGILISNSYQVNKKNFDLLKSALEEKKAGIEYSDSGFEKIIK